jgi:hypothetical protein
MKKKSLREYEKDEGVISLIRNKPLLASTTANIFVITTEHDDDTAVKDKTRVVREITVTKIEKN